MYEEDKEFWRMVSIAFLVGLVMWAGIWFIIFMVLHHTLGWQIPWEPPVCPPPAAETAPWD